MSAVRVYVAGIDGSGNPEIKYSNDLGATWEYTNYGNYYSSPITSIAVSPNDPNLLVVTSQLVLLTDKPGIALSFDGGVTWQQAQGSWLTFVPSGSGIGGTSGLTFTSDGQTIWTISDGTFVRQMVKGVGPGFNFTEGATTNYVYGANVLIHAIAADGNVAFMAAGAGTALQPTRVYRTTTDFTAVTLLGSPGPSYNVGSLAYDLASDTLYAVTLNGVYRSVASGAFTLLYTFPDAHFTVTSIKNASYIDGTLYVNSRTTLYATADEFATAPTVVYNFGGPNLTGSSFYAVGKGFPVGNGTDIFYTADNGVNINDTNTDANFFPTYPATSLVVGCGCEPGFTWDEASQLCITNTPMCPEGFIYNPDTNDCEGTDPAGCDTDVAIVIDISGSISATEMPEYKNMLRGIIDGLEMGYDSNGNLNTLANSLGRITSGEIRVGIVFFTTFPYATVGGVTLNYGPTAWQSGGANNSPSGTVANAGLLKAAINNMGFPLLGNPGTIPDQYGILPTQGTGYTNSFAGLGKGYDVVWGTNSRPAANKKILFVTDGWPNYIDPNTLITNYGVTLPAIITSFGTTPANSVCGAYGVDDISSVIQATYQERRLADYIATMDLAQEIKAGTAVPNTGSGGSTEITLLITGEPIEQNITKSAFVGVDPTDSVTPCYLENSSIFTSFVKDNSDNISIPGGAISLGTCPSWNGSYTTSDKFPSNAVSGLPDYYQTDLIPSSYAGIGLSISASVVCSISQSPLACNNPCQIIQDPTTLAYFCNCVSSVPFNSCCYDLINCADNTVYASVNTTGQSNDFMAQFIGQYISIEGVAACLYVSLNSGCTSSTTLNVTVDQITTYADCISCNEVEEVDPYYNLYNCSDPSTIVFQTTTDLSSYLTGGTNQGLPILTFVEYPNLCFTVQETFTFLPQTVVTVDVAYNDCPTCLSYLC
jgi:hypothetical protein